MPPARAEKPSKSPPKKPAPVPEKPALTVRDVSKQLKKIDRALVRTPKKDAPALPLGELPELLSHLASPDDRVRAEAARALGERGAREAIAPLRERLADPSRAVASAAALSLVRLGDPHLLAEALKDLRGDDPDAAAAAAEMLGLSKRKEAVPPLLALLEKGAPEAHPSAVRALGLIADGAGTDALLKLVEANRHVPLACEALGRIGDARARPLLTRTLMHADGEARAAAARALGAAPLRSKKSVPELKKLLEDPAPRVRFAAALSLYDLGEKKAAARLSELLAKA